MDFRQAAVVCGLGSVGLGGFILTPEFGPLARFAFILTDAPLQTDPPHAASSLCDRCGACASACPGQAINPHATPETALDEWQCAAHYLGANPAINPFLSDTDAGKMPHPSHRCSEKDARGLESPLHGAYWPVRFGYHACICGRACWRACLAHLEEKRLLPTRFARPFRMEAPWRIGRTG